LSIADIVLCSKAIRDEGTSHHYVANGKYAAPDKWLTGRLSEGMNACGIAHRKGVTWTTDAAFAETRQEIRHYRAEGVATVDMEAATLFAVAKKRAVKAAAVFAISDILGEKWSGFHDDISKGFDRLAKVALLFKDGI
jgi:purine-nucleoside phosphorylase